MGNSIVIFYSLSGFTKKIANIIAEHTGSDILELHPQKPIKNTGFMKYIWGGKQVMMKETPELKKYDLDIKQYQKIYIGTPVRAYTFAPAIRTFFNNHNIKDKEIGIFCTHEGGPAKTLEDMKAELSENKIIFKKDFNRKLLEKDNDKLTKEIESIL